MEIAPLFLIFSYKWVMFIHVGKGGEGGGNETFKSENIPSSLYLLHYGTICF